MVLSGDSISWHVSAAVRTWRRAHNRRVKATGHGVRLRAGARPSRSPWLNPMEPTWTHGKRRVVEPDRLLPPDELVDRVGAASNCAHEPHLVIPETAA